VLRYRVHCDFSEANGQKLSLRHQSTLQYFTSCFQSNTLHLDTCTCNTGETASSSTCSSQHYVTATKQPIGYIVSDVTQTTGVGSERCPWVVVVGRGQRIRITLYDLTITKTSRWSGQRQSTQTQEGRCLLYATIREGLESDVIGDHMICSGGDEREHVVYTSRDHTLTITIHYAPGNQFILQYEGLCRQHYCLLIFPQA